MSSKLKKALDSVVVNRHKLTVEEELCMEEGNTLYIRDLLVREHREKEDIVECLSNLAHKATTMSSQMARLHRRLVNFRSSRRRKKNEIRSWLGSVGTDDEVLQDFEEKFGSWFAGYDDD